MKKLILAAILLAPATAFAQAEQPPTAGSAVNVPAKAATKPEAAPPFEDPSDDFNWASHLSPFGDDSYKKFDAKGGPLGDGKMGNEPLLPGQEEEPMSVPFVYFLLNFGVVLLLLGWKAGPIARDMAAKRSDDIKTALDEAARLRNAAKTKLDEYSTKLKAAESEIDDMIKAMRDSAEAEKQRIIAAAEAQAALLKKEAEERIAAEIERARHTLQREVVLAATAVAEKLLREKSTAADQAAQIDAFLVGVTAKPEARS